MTVQGPKRGDQLPRGPRLLPGRMGAPDGRCKAIMKAALAAVCKDLLTCAVLVDNGYEVPAGVPRPIAWTLTSGCVTSGWSQNLSGQCVVWAGNLPARPPLLQPPEVREPIWSQSRWRAGVVAAVGLCTWPGESHGALWTRSSHSAVQ